MIYMAGFTLPTTIDIEVVTNKWPFLYNLISIELNNNKPNCRGYDNIQKLTNLMCHNGEDNIIITVIKLANTINKFPHLKRWSWWHHQMETFANKLLFTGHRWIPLTKTSDAELRCVFYLCLNKRLSNQSWIWWFETPSHLLWCHRNDKLMIITAFSIQNDGKIDLQTLKLSSAVLSYGMSLSNWWCTLRWRHNRHDGVSNHQPPQCLLNRLFGSRSKKTSNLGVTGLCAGNSPGTSEFPAQMACNAENVSIWWRHNVSMWSESLYCTCIFNRLSMPSIYMISGFSREARRGSVEILFKAYHWHVYSIHGSNFVYHVANQLKVTFLHASQWKHRVDNQWVIIKLPTVRKHTLQHQSHYKRSQDNLSKWRNSSVCMTSQYHNRLTHREQQWRSDGLRQFS